MWRATIRKRSRGAFSPTSCCLAVAGSPSHQNRGLGERLASAVIDYARAAGAELVFLETNSALPTAIRLYERLGFAHVPRPHPSAYARSDVYMELRLIHGAASQMNTSP